MLAQEKQYGGYLPEERDYHEITQLLTPEGFDVSQPDEAERYARIFNPNLPESLPLLLDVDDGYHLVMRLGEEDRAAMNENGFPQTVAEHSYFVAATAFLSALRLKNERPNLNPERIAVLALFHDLLEAYARDTVITDEIAMLTKPWREAAAWTLLKRDYGDTPFWEYLEELREGKTEDAIYVKTRDKIEPYQHAVHNNAILHHQRGEEYEPIVKTALAKVVKDKTNFAAMQKVLVALGGVWPIKIKEYGGVVFEGTPEEIVQRNAQAALRDYANMLEQEIMKRSDESPVGHVIGPSVVALTEEYEASLIEQAEEHRAEVISMIGRTARRSRLSDPAVALRLHDGIAVFKSALPDQSA